jgi:acetyltransferase-like isoleucine patch superfamily enzyme
VISCGRHSYLLRDIDCNVDLKVGSFTSIASGLKIVSGQHPPIEYPKCVSTFPFAEHQWGEYPPSKHDGEVVIGSDVWIGQDVNILEGVTVGHGAIVGACSVVTRDVKPFTVVAGNPARERGLRFRKMGNIAEALLHIAWWDWTDEEIKEALPHFADINDFIEYVQRKERSA